MKWKHGSCEIHFLGGRTTILASCVLLVPVARTYLHWGLTAGAGVLTEALLNINHCACCIRCWGEWGMRLRPQVRCLKKTYVVDANVSMHRCFEVDPTVFFSLDLLPCSFRFVSFFCLFFFFSFRLRGFCFFFLLSIVNLFGFASGFFFLFCFCVACVWVCCAFQ